VTRKAANKKVENGWYGYGIKNLALGMICGAGHAAMGSFWLLMGSWGEEWDFLNMRISFRRRGQIA